MATKVISELLRALDIHPVLIDIGSSGGPPVIWDHIAQHSIYLGFDPSQSETQELEHGRFYKTIVVNKAVTSERGADEVAFYFTKSPSCSSMLRPDTESLLEYLFADLFVVEREEGVVATSLDSVLDQFCLRHVDWFKTDSQGVDLRLFNSLSDQIRGRVLAIDVEPGLIDAYVGEDLFVDTHRGITREGFWLSNLEVQGAVRLRRETYYALSGSRKDTPGQPLERILKKSPAWCEARYLRTLKSLVSGDFGKREYLVLWIFAVLDGQVGFAADVTIEYEGAFGKDSVSKMMRDAIQLCLRRPTYARLFSAAGSFLPAGSKRRIKKYLRGLLQ
jgi:hypothetical protein